MGPLRDNLLLGLGHGFLIVKGEGDGAPRVLGRAHPLGFGKLEEGQVSRAGPAKSRGMLICFMNPCGYRDPNVAPE